MQPPGEKDHPWSPARGGVTSTPGIAHACAMAPDQESDIAAVQPGFWLDLMSSAQREKVVWPGIVTACHS
jgi:hypothetical protein